MTIVRATVRAAGALAVTMLAQAAVIGAQVPAIPLGTRVRLDAPRPNAGLAGTVRSQSADSITIETDDSTRVVSLASVRRIDVSEGRSSRDGAFRGMKIGGLGLGGAMAAFLIAGYVASPNHNCGGADECLDPIAALPYLVPASALIGGLAGAFIGAIAGAERWDRLYPRPVRVSILPTPTGVAMVRLSVRF
jgi:hypothetical protein